jgi:DNA-binding transcriptional ArsR family regulator
MSDGDADTGVPEAAFKALGSEVRLAILRSLADAEDDEPVAFSTLFEAAPVDADAGLAYHLRQLTDRYVTGSDDGYELTYAGRKVARAVAAGTYTESVDAGPIRLDGACPFCDAEAVTAEGSDNVLTVSCGECEAPVLSLPFPPSGYVDRDEDAVAAAFDRRHRHRLAMLRGDVCPECAGVVDREFGDVTAVAEGGGDDPPAPLQVRQTCRRCGYALASPVTLTLLEHPAVVSFYRDHGEAIRERPLWNVGEEWGEVVVSTDPFCVRVSASLADETLSLFLDRDLRVLETRRDAVEE